MPRKNIVGSFFGLFISAFVAGILLIMMNPEPLI